MKLRTVKKKSSVAFECLGSASADDLKGIEGRKILLVGDTVFASLEANTTPSAFVKQMPRESVASIKMLLGKSTQKIHVAVDERLFSLSRARFALALDGYLAWGLAQKRQGTLVLLGGCSSARTTSIEIVVFSGGSVTEVNEKNLPAPSDAIFKDALAGMIAGLRSKYPTARFVQAAPLSDWGLDDVEFIGDQPLKRLSYRPLVRTYKSSRAMVVPAMIAGAGLIMYAGAMSAGWSNYSSAVAEYDEAIMDASIRDQGGIDTNFLDVMNARRFYMNQPRRQLTLTQESMSVVRGIGVVKDVQIMEIKLPAPSIDLKHSSGILVNPDQARQRQQIMPNRTPDVWMSIAVPRSHTTAILQAKDVMTSIANSTGMSLRLAHQGWKDDKERRVFNIEGFIHD